MAAPTFFASGAIAAGVGAIAPVLPTGSGGVITDDLVLVVTETDSADGSTTMDQSGHSGISFSKLTEHTQGGTTLTIWYGWATASPPTLGASYLPDPGNHQMGRTVVFRGVDQVNPFGSIATDVDTTVDTSGTAPGGTNPTPDSIIVWAFSGSVDAANSSTNCLWDGGVESTPRAEIFDHQRADGNGGSFSMFYATKTASGSYASHGFTLVNATEKALLSFAVRSTSSIGQISETDSVTALGESKSKAIGLVTETDTAQAIGRTKSKAIGLVTETDSVTSMSATKSKAIGIAEETDIALPISTPGSSLPIGLVTETDTALPIGVSKSKAIGIAEETDIALPITVTTVGGPTSRQRPVIGVGE